MTPQETDTAPTRDRILTVAADLFSRHGYAATPLSDIAAALGITKAALYYHYRSKDEILDAIMAEAVAALGVLAERARAGTASPEELLAGLIDMATRSGTMVAAFANDPSIRTVIEERATQHDIHGKLNAVLAALAGPEPDAASAIRARAAYAVAKETTAALLLEHGGTLPADARAEILAAALRALG
ncbi:MAG: TetR family transcriptional regulator [Mycobacteriales bacterium]